MTRRLETFLLWSISHPKAVALGHIMVTAVTVYLASGIQFDFTIENLFPHDDPEVEDYFQFRDDFEREDDIIYAAYLSSDPFSYQNLQSASELTHAFQSIEGMGQVTSLTNVELFDPGEELEVSPVLDPIPQDSLALARRVAPHVDGIHGSDLGGGHLSHQSYYGGGIPLTHDHQH